MSYNRQPKRQEVKEWLLAQNHVTAEEFGWIDTNLFASLSEALQIAKFDHEKADEVLGRYPELIRAIIKS